MVMAREGWSWFVVMLSPGLGQSCALGRSGGQPARATGLRSRQFVKWAIRSQGGTSGPGRRVAAAAAEPRASSASPSGVPVGSIGAHMESSRTAMMVAHSRSHDALAVARRIQPRTVSAGSPRSAAIRRWLAPLTLASSTSPTTCTVTARRGRPDAGSSTWVVRQPRQRPRRGLSWVVPSWPPRTDRRRRTPTARADARTMGTRAPRPRAPGPRRCRV